ncbi:MAG: hypothetical protein N3G79_01585 [Sulfolobales archaeon]|nr:hypothetical protein [Sulfolobales archaeon]
MERIVGRVGTKLVEPLWRRDPTDLLCELCEEVTSRVELLLIGSLKSIRE